MTGMRLPGSPGPRLKAYRTALGITVRDVEAYSHHIAQVTDNPAFVVSHSYLSSLESGRKGVPSLHKLFTLSVVYRIRFVDLLLSYGLDLENIARFEVDVRLPRTHVVWHDIYEPNRTITFPVRFDPSFRLENTDLLSRIVSTWGDIPIGFIEDMGARKRLYGYIGTKDFTLYPLIRPGSIVTIDDSDTEVQTSGWKDEFDRPIYFLEHVLGYICGWCDLVGKRLNLIPYSKAKSPLSSYELPEDVHVIGRVTGVAMSLNEPLSNRPVPRKRFGDVGSSGRSPAKSDSAASMDGESNTKVLDQCPHDASTGNLEHSTRPVK